VEWLGFVWTLPNTVLGLLIGLLTFQFPRAEAGVLIFDRTPRGLSGTPISRAVFRRFTAFTVGAVIVAREPVGGILLQHEFAHVRQYRLWGPLYLPVYGLLYLLFGYRRHPFERAAMRETGETTGLREP
jgi:hypothetical protein